MSGSENSAHLTALGAESDGEQRGLQEAVLAGIIVVAVRSKRGKRSKRQQIHRLLAKLLTFLRSVPV